MEESLWKNDESSYQKKDDGCRIADDEDEDVGLNVGVEGDGDSGTLKRREMIRIICV